MTHTVELSPDLEERLREEAARQGIDTASFIARALQERLIVDRSQAPRLSKSESELLQRINLGFSEENWRRYRELVAKRRDETLTADEHPELVALSNLLEEANSRRLSAIGELARMRGKSLEVVMNELGIVPVSVISDD